VSSNGIEHGNSQKRQVIRETPLRKFRNIWRALCGVLLFAKGAHDEGRTDRFLTALGAGFVIGIAGFVRQQRQSSRYHCPECDSLLPYSTQGEAKRIQFHCERCDITWDSGMMEGRD
jgi:hypothetical protein